MAYDPYTAIWLSHSSINDFLSCKRLYFLKNIFKDPISKRKINIVSPYLSLGIAIHNTLEPLKEIETTNRELYIKNNLINNYKNNFDSLTGKKGGFKNKEEENEFFERGLKIMKNILKDTMILINKVIPEKYFWNRDLHNGFNPHFPIDIENNLILTGAIDWLEYLEKDNSIRIIDFKTGKNEEKEDSFQLPIYYLLITELDIKKKYKVSEMAYWYLDSENKKIIEHNNSLEIKKIDAEFIKKVYLIKEEIINIGKEIKKLKNENNNFKCNNEIVEGEGCKNCNKFEKICNFIQKRENSKLENNENILNIGEEEESFVEYVGISQYKQDLYIVK